MDGDTKQITYNSKVLYDYNKDKSGSFGGYAFSDGQSNTGNSEFLRKGGRNADWIDFNGAFNQFLRVFGLENRNAAKNMGKGTNGGRPVDDDKIKDVMTTIEKLTGATKTSVETVNSSANEEIEKPKLSKPSEFIFTNRDSNNPNNDFRVRRDVFESQQKKKNEKY
jgi:hypothetical protein